MVAAKPLTEFFALVFGAVIFLLLHGFWADMTEPRARGELLTLLYRAGDRPVGGAMIAGCGERRVSDANGQVERPPRRWRKEGTILYVAVSERVVPVRVHLDDSGELETIYIEP